LTPDRAVPDKKLRKAFKRVVAHHLTTDNAHKRTDLLTPVHLGRSLAQKTAGGGTEPGGSQILLEKGQSRGKSAFKKHSAMSSGPCQKGRKTQRGPGRTQKKNKGNRSKKRGNRAGVRLYKISARARGGSKRKKKTQNAARRAPRGGELKNEGLEPLPKKRGIKTGLVEKPTTKIMANGNGTVTSHYK